MSVESPLYRTQVGNAVSSVFDRRESSVLVGLIAIFAVGVFVDPGRFLQIETQLRILQSAAIVTIVGYGMALLMVTGEFDLSVGSIFAISGALGAIMISDHGYSASFTIVAVVTLAVLFGITQGLLVTKLGLPSLIITIGTLTLIRGAHLRLLGGTSATKGPSEGGMLLTIIGDRVALPFGWEFDYQLPLIHDTTQTWDAFPLQILWVFVFLAIFHYLLFYTRFGYHVRATGDNINSVQTTGVDSEIIKLTCFGICSGIAAFAGLAQLARINSVSGSTGDGLALIVIAAVVLGGTKLTGGEGSMIGVLMGALVLSLAQEILTMAGYGSGGWPSIITGLFIIAAIGLDTVFKGFTINLLNRWYVTPIRHLAGSPRAFFRTKSTQKTTDDTMAFLVLSSGTTIAIVIAGVWITDAIAPAVGLGDVLSFSLLAGDGILVAAVQTYMLVLLLTVLAFASIVVLSRYFDGTGDYEDTIAIVCYGMAPVALLAVPMLVNGYGVVVVVSSTITALLLALPVIGLIGVTMYYGILELHDLSRRRALLTVVATVLSWALAAAWVVVSVS